MPINSIHFRAEIGNFYNVLQQKCVKKTCLYLCKNTCLLNGIYTELNRICLPSSRETCDILVYLVCLVLFLSIMPLVAAYTLIFSRITKLYRYCVICYVWIYISLRFIFNLLCLAIVYRETLIRFLNYFALRYILFFQLFVFLPYIRLALIISGDIETNPGPNLDDQNLTVCHWNLNGIVANDFIKIAGLEAYNAIYNFDIICISETYLDSYHSSDDARLRLPGYALIRADHPSNTKRGGVCILYKEHLPFICRDDIKCLDECIVGEIKIKKSKCFLTCLYRSPSQTEDETEQFLLGFEQMCSSIALESPFCSIIIGDLNAKCTNWWTQGTNNTCGLQLYDLTTILGYSQLINEPTNLEPSKNPTCIDLIFTNQPNLVVESGVHPSLYHTCHHQIIHAEICFKVHYPSPYEREVWHYKRAQIELIRKSIDNFDWKKAFLNLNTNDQVELFNYTLLNIFRNFIPHDTIKCNSKDPPWMNENIKSALRKKNRIYRKYISGGRKPNDEIKLRETTDFISNLIETSRSSYFKNLSMRLNDPATSSKSYWSILKRFLNKVKIPEIPPLLVNGIFETNFENKAGIFNTYFANQCSILENSSVIPQLHYKTDKRVSNISFSSSDLSNIIKDLNPNKAHGHDNISIKMIKLCGNSIIPPLKLIFESAIKSGHFPNSWKKGNIIPVHKKESKNFVKNYRPISLLPIFGKIFEKVIFNNLFKYFDENRFLSVNQSGFRRGDSCVSQLLGITHNLYKTFDGNPSYETRGVFLDMSKAFDKVWHEGLLFKLKCYGVKGQFYDILENYLHDRKQRVVLNGKSSTWLNVNAGVPQGSVLGPLLFLIYINDLPEGLVSISKLFADDTSIFSKVVDVNQSSQDLNDDLNIVKNWAFQWKMTFNPDLNKQATEVVFSHKKQIVTHPTLYFNNTPIVTAPFQKHLGLILDNKLNFAHHLNEKISKANKGIGLIKRLYYHLPRKSLLTIYKSFIRPHLDYCDVIYDQPHNDTLCKMIESVQYNAALAITGTIKGSSRERLYQELGLESLRDRRWYRRLVYFFNIISHKSPDYLHALIPDKQISYDASRCNLFRMYATHTDYFKNSFFPYCVNEWNKLGCNLRNSVSISKFKKSLQNFIRPKSRTVFDIYDPIGLKLLSRLRVKLSHLREHKFRHNFLDTINPLCTCSLEIESSNHYLLRCPFFASTRKHLLDSIVDLIGPISNFSDDNLLELLLYGNENYNVELNASILKCTIIFLKSSGRFDMPLI